MPRIRPPLRTQEEIEKVPVTEPVEIALSDPDAPIEVTSGSSDEAAVQAVEPDRGAEDDAADALKQQLQAAQQAEQQARLREQQAEQRRQQAELQARNAMAGAEAAQYDAVVQAIGGATAEADAAQRDYEAADTAGDSRAKAEAQRRLSRAEARLVALEDGKLAYEANLEQRRQQPPQQQPANAFEAYLDTLGGLRPDEKQWLRSHPDAITDPRKNAALNNAYYEASAKHQRGSTEYFAHIETALGYRQPTQAPRQETSQQRRPTVGAPPSREPPSSGSGVSPTRVSLSPAHREAARIAGISDLEYARNLVKLQQAKQDGNYPMTQDEARYGR